MSKGGCVYVHARIFVEAGAVFIWNKVEKHVCGMHQISIYASV